MGKVGFPLINVRKDVTSAWQMHHYSGDEVEIIQVPQFSDEYGFYTVWLKEVPDSGSANLNTTPVKINGLTEFRGIPVDPNTKRLKLTPIQYFVNYQTGQILFHPSQAGMTLKVDYWGKGSLVEADDINHLYEMIQRLEKEHDVPEFTKFEIDGFSNKFEVGQIFPNESVPFNVKFKYELTHPQRIKSKSIKIENLTTENVIVDEVSDIESTTVEFHEIFRFTSPSELKFRISAVGINDDPISKDLILSWTDRIYWGVSPTMELTEYDILGFDYQEHLNEVKNEYLVKIKYPSIVDCYKVLAVPKRLKVQQMVDTETSLRFIFQDPIEMEIKNEYGLKIPYLVYISSYPIIKGVELIGKIGGGE